MRDTNILIRSRKQAFGISAVLILALLTYFSSIYFKKQEMDKIESSKDEEILSEKFNFSSNKLSLLDISYILSNEKLFLDQYEIEYLEFQKYFEKFKNLNFYNNENQKELFRELILKTEELRKIERNSQFENRTATEISEFTLIIQLRAKLLRRTYNELLSEFDRENQIIFLRYQRYASISMYSSMLLSLTTVCLVLYHLLFYTLKHIVLPLHTLSKEVKRLIQGKNIEMSFQDRNSELGELARAISILYKDFISERALKETREKMLEKTREEIQDQLGFVSVLIDIIPFPLFYKDSDTRFIGFNKAYEEIFNVDRKDLIGKKVLDLDYLPETDRILYQKEDEDVIQNSSELKKEMPIPFADGKIHYTLYWIKGFRKKDGSPGGLIGTFIDISQQKEIEKLYDEVREEKEKSDKLLLNILPQKVADELKETGIVTPVYYDEITILFTDFKGFTQIAQKMTPQELIKELDSCFSQFDKIAERYKLEKLKTIGDSYMCAAGLYKRNEPHALYTALAALEIRNLMNQVKFIKESLGFPYWELRIGMHSGPVMAGVVGEKKFAYDIWGDTVNTASRMESSGVAGQVNISESTHHLIEPYFEFTYRGEVDAKNKGKVKMFFIERIKPKYSVDKEGFVPSENLLSLL